MTGTPLAWLHIGDLHIKQPGAPNLCDLHRIVALEASVPSSATDFGPLPGDNADDGTPDQCRLIRAAFDGLRTPVDILPGDHDVAQGDLKASDRDLVEPWTDRGIVGGQLGPNRNGQQW